VITLPEQVTQSGDVSIRCHGQVVRVEASDNGHMGVAAKIERYRIPPRCSLISFVEKYPPVPSSAGNAYNSYLDE